MLGLYDDPVLIYDHITNTIFKYTLYYEHISKLTFNNS